MIIVNKYSALSALVMAAGGVVCSVGVWYLGAVPQAILFALYALACMGLAARWGALHPIIWFTPFYWAYSVTYTLSIQSGDPNAFGYARNVIPMSLSGYVAFAVITLLLSSNKVLLERARRGSVAMVSRTSGIDFGALVFLTISIAGALAVLRSGVASKRDYLNLSEGGLLGYMILAFQIPTAGMVLRSVIWTWKGAALRKVLFNRLAIIVYGASVIVFGVTGERDHFFRLLLMMGLLVYSEFYVLRLIHVVIALALSFVLMPLTHAAKAFMISNSFRDFDFSSAMSASDFASAGRVFDYVLMKDIDWLAGQTVIDAFKRLLFISGDSMSATGWFHNVARGYYGDSGTSGWGFSLAAEGFINFGIFGPVLILGFVGLIAVVLFRRAYRSPFMLMFYLLFCGSAIYSIRADVSNLLVQTFHHNLLIVVFFWVLARGGAKLGWWRYDASK